MRLFIKLILSAFMVLVPCVSKAQSENMNTVGSRLHYSMELYGSRISSDFKMGEVELDFGYKFGHSFSIYAPISFSCQFYNANTTKNYDSQFKLGIGAGYSRFFSRISGLGATLSVSSTIGKNDFNYLQTKLMAKYLMRNSQSSNNGNTALGVGIQYLSPYDDSLEKGRFYPVLSIGWIF